MNGAQLHLAINHFPVILSMVCFAILLWGWLSKSYEIKKVGLVLAVVSAAFAGAAFLTGEPAEEVLEKLPGFSEELVHEHEESGEFAFVISIIAGVAAIGTLYLSKVKTQFFSRGLIFTIALVLLSCLTFLRTAHLGGLIRHEEIRESVAK